MIYLVLGLVLFLGIHSISIIAPAWRDRIAVRLGNAWRGMYSLISIAGFIVIVWGYGIARQHPVVLYAPPAWTHYITAVLMLPVFTLFLAAYLPGRIKAALKHPMLLSVMLWAVAHLISAGTLANVVLFGSFFAWAIADRISFRWRTQRPIAMAPSMKLNDGVAIVAGLAVYVVFEHWLHLRWIGVQPLPM
ncbi:MAG TPA: NnrU family protein [Steroidobacteraceae bacterium]|nr:NnrU family protein [Steroidobacteraceae bacterium]